MYKIETAKELKMSHVFSVSKKLTMAQFQREIQTIGQFFHANGIQKKGPVVTVTHGIEHVDGEQIMNMEILVPMDGSFDLPSPYVFKPHFHLVNALYVRHQGHPSKLQEAYEKLGNYISENKLQPITPAYAVTVEEPQSMDHANDAVIDLYVGINPSAL